MVEGLTGSGPAPRATLVLLVFNQIATVRDAALACLSQDCEPIEILFSDDVSTDGSYEWLQTLVDSYRGPHRLRLRRNERNLGIGGHYNAIVEASRGELIITAAGDDISHSNRVRRLLQAWDASGQTLDLIASHAVDMDAQGMDHGVLKVDQLAHWAGPQSWVRKRPYVIGATHAFTRRLHSRFGPIEPALRYEDQVMALRATMGGGGVTVEEPLVRYRRGGLSSRDTGGVRPARLDRLRKKYGQQALLYGQIQRDLTQARLSTLWPGKLAQTHQRALAVLHMVGERQSSALAPGLAVGVGWVWLLRYTWYLRVLRWLDDRA